MIRWPSSFDRTTLHTQAAHYQTSSTPCANASPPIASTTQPPHQSGDPRNETTDRSPSPACNHQTATTPASACHAHPTTPYENDDSTPTLPPRDVASSRATPAADRKDCTNESAALIR